MRGGVLRMVMAVLEGIVMCFVLLIICVVGITDGPVGMVFFYEKEVQDNLLCNIDDGTHRFHLSYFSSPERWKEYFLMNMTTI